MENEVEVMRVIRVPPRGKLVVEVGENRYEKITDIEKEPLGRFLLTAIGELVIFANGYSTLVNAGVAPPIAEGEAGSANFSKSLEERQALFLASLEEQRAAELARPAATIVEEEPVEEAPSEPVSIVEQINPILKKHVDADPGLQGRKIYLEDDPTGGLSIKVDGRLYERPEQIEDNQVRKVIAAALREWDSS